MPPLPPAGSVLKIHLEYEGATPFGSRFFMAYTGGPPTSANLTTMASDISSAWASDLAPIVPADINLTEVDIWDLSSSSGATGTSTTVHPGTRSGTSMMQNVATLLDFEILRRYRGGKPRMYLPPGVPADQDTLAQWTPDFLTAVNSAWSSFVTALTGLTGVGCTLTGQVNVSYYSGGARRTTPVIDTITGHVAKANVSTQRRRIAR